MEVMLSQLLISTSLFLIRRHGSDMTSSDKLLPLYKPSSQPSPRAFLPTGEKGMLLECLGIIMAFISYQKLEQQLKHSALIQTDEDAAEAPWDNPQIQELVASL